MTGAFWRDESGETRHLPLEWVRREGATEEQPTSEERLVVPDASWTFRGHSHFLSYVDPDGGSNRTVLRVEAEQVTLVRYGDVRWTHTFRQGASHSSTMQVGPYCLLIETVTERLAVKVTETGGRIDLAYQMQIAGEEQAVTLSIRFGEGVEVDHDETV